VRNVIVLNTNVR